MGVPEAKRVLIFSLTYFPFVGGAEVAVKEITDRIDQSAVAFDLVTLHIDANLPKVERIGNVTVHRIGFAKPGMTLSDLARFPNYFSKVMFVWHALNAARKLLKTKRYHLLWSIMTNMGFPVVLLKLLDKNTTPFLLTLQDGDTKEYIAGRLRIRMFQPLFKRIFELPNRVQAISSHLARFAKEMGYRGIVSVIPNGVEYARFSDAKWEREGRVIAHRFDKKPNDIYLITTSRLVEKNGIESVIRALPQLPEGVKFLVLGEGPLGHSLWNLACALRVEKRVRMLGHVSHDRLPAYLYASDIFIRPSLSEGMGNSFIEAMAAGLPVIATPVGGITDFLFDPKTPLGKVTPTGVFCAPHNPESIVNAVTLLTTGDTLRNKIVGSARAMVRDKYDWDRIAKNMGVLLDETMKRV